MLIVLAAVACFVLVDGRGGDPLRRVSPTLQSNDSRWRSALSALVLTAAATALAVRRRP